MSFAVLTEVRSHPSKSCALFLHCATLYYLFLQRVQQKGFASLNLLRLYPSFYFIELGRPTNHMTACWHIPWICSHNRLMRVTHILRNQISSHPNLKAKNEPRYALKDRLVQQYKALYTYYEQPVAILLHQRRRVITKHAPVPASWPYNNSTNSSFVPLIVKQAASVGELPWYYKALVLHKKVL